MGSSKKDNSKIVFKDLFPSMVEKLGADGFLNELSNGFNLLMDGEKEAITIESLKKNSAALGLGEMSEEDVKCMLREGDLDGDGKLSKMEFCVLMFRLSPELMNESKRWLNDLLLTELVSNPFVFDGE